MRSKSINFRLKPEQVEALEKAANDAGVSVSDLVRKVVSESIDPQAQTVVQRLSSIDNRLEFAAIRLLNIELAVCK